MESGKSRERHDHRKKKKWKHLSCWRRQLGIQGNTQEETDVYYCLKKAMKRIGILEWNDSVKEEQILRLIKEKDCDSQRQMLALQQELLLKSSAYTREELIQTQRKRIENDKLRIMELKQEILDLKTQIWPDHG